MPTSNLVSLPSESEFRFRISAKKSCINICDDKFAFGNFSVEMVNRRRESAIVCATRNACFLTGFSGDALSYCVTFLGD